MIYCYAIFQKGKDKKSRHKNLSHMQIAMWFNRQNKHTESLLKMITIIDNEKDIFK